MRLLIELNRDELDALQYPVMVEGWHKVKDQGSKRRKWLAEFDEKERALLGKYYNLFYDWHLHRGTPEHLAFRKMETIDLIKRAVEFFATV